MALSQEKFEEMIKEMDKDGDGSVDKVRPLSMTASHAPEHGRVVLLLRMPAHLSDCVRSDAPVQRIPD